MPSRDRSRRAVAMPFAERRIELLNAREPSVIIP
jgi:hypothetical protein